MLLDIKQEKTYHEE